MSSATATVRSRQLYSLLNGFSDLPPRYHHDRGKCTRCEGRSLSGRLQRAGRAAKGDLNDR